MADITEIIEEMRRFYIWIEECKHRKELEVSTTTK